jgi:hypothetical protein
MRSKEEGVTLIFFYSPRVRVYPNPSQFSVLTSTASSTPKPARFTL